MNKILIFGAGRIGRSFIGQLFSLGGYKVIFVDINAALVHALKERKSYPVIIRSDKRDDTMIIRNINALHLSDKRRILKEVESVSLIATAVGQANLPDIIPILARGIRKKMDRQEHPYTDIIIAENLRNAASYFQDKLSSFFTPQEIKANIGLIETSIGKMVPLMTQSDLEKDITQVFAEPYNTLILDGKGFLNPMPDIKGLAPKDNMKAWVDRKSFIHNLGHAAAVYFGFLKHPECTLLSELLTDPEIIDFARSTMIQSGNILRSMHPGEFSEEDILVHIEDLLERFLNRKLGDTVFRVGMDLYRKLGKEDRLAGVIHQALKRNMPYDKILYALICGMYFRGSDEKGLLFNGDRHLSETLQAVGYQSILENLCGFDPTNHKEIFILSENYHIEILTRFDIKNE